jgi:hypothetical protein
MSDRPRSRQILLVGKVDELESRHHFAKFVKLIVAKGEMRNALEQVCHRLIERLQRHEYRYQRRAIDECNDG